MSDEVSPLLSSSTLHQALEVVAEGVVIADAEGRFVLFNQAAEEILGIGALGTDPDSWSSDYGLFHPDRSGAFPPEEIPLAKALNGESTDGVEMFVRNPQRPKGLYIQVSGRPILGEGSQVQGGIVIFRDVTELRERQEALSEVNRSLRESNASLQDFVSVASHDLRGPIAAVVGFASTMRKSWDTIKDEDKRHYVQIIERQARGAMALCDDLLTISRLQAGELRAHTEDLPLQLAIHDAVEAIAELEGQVTVDCPDEIEVACDPQHLQRMLSNYLINSTRYGHPPITIYGREEGGKVIIEVQDSGPGVPESERARLFERFARGENAVPGSTGLGLSIVLGLARRNGGDAYYVPSSGGARFALELPSPRAG